MIYNTADEKILDFNNGIIKEIAFSLIAELQKNINLKWDLEKGYRDRIGEMGRKENRENPLFNRALEFYSVLGFDIEFCYEFFQVLEKEEFIRLIGICHKTILKFESLLENGNSEKEIFEEYGRRELIMYFARERIRRKEMGLNKI